MSKKHLRMLARNQNAAQLQVCVVSTQLIFSELRNFTLWQDCTSLTTEETTATTVSQPSPLHTAVLSPSAALPSSSVLVSSQLLQEKNLLLSTDQLSSTVSTHDQPQHRASLKRKQDDAAHNYINNEPQRDKNHQQQTDPVKKLKVEEVEQLRTYITTSPCFVPSTPFFCYTCGKNFNSDHQKQQHLAGRLHFRQEKIIKLLSAITAVPSNSVTEDISLKLPQ